MEDDIDIYADLPSFETKDYENIAQKNKELTQKCAEQEKKIKELIAELEVANQDTTTLKNNVSSLLKTAKAEVRRKDRTISELRSELDNRTFRRGNFKRDKNYPTRHKNHKDNVKIDNKFDKKVERTKAEIFPEFSQPIFDNVSKDEAENFEQNYEPGRGESTVFGERLKKKIMLELEAERIQKDELERIRKEEEELAAVNNVVLTLTKEKPQDIGNCVKKPLETAPIKAKKENESRETFDALIAESSTPSLTGSLHSSDEDLKNRKDKRSLTIATESLTPSLTGSLHSSDEDFKNRKDKRSQKRLNEDLSRSENKRRRAEEERYKCDDNLRYYPESLREDDRYYFEKCNNSRYPRDPAKCVDSRARNYNFDEFERMRETRWEKSSRHKDRRHNERHSERDRHRADTHRIHGDKAEKRRDDSCNRVNNDFIDFNKKKKNFYDLREKIEQRFEANVGGRVSPYNSCNSYKNEKLDRDCYKRSGKSRSPEKHRSDSNGRFDGREIERRQSPQSRSSERLVIEDKHKMEVCKTRESERNETIDWKNFNFDRTDREDEPKLQTARINSRKEIETSNVKITNAVTKNGSSLGDKPKTLYEKLFENTDRTKVMKGLKKIRENGKTEFIDRKINGVSDKDCEDETKYENDGLTSEVRAELPKQTQPNANCVKITLEMYKKRENRKRTSVDCKVDGNEDKKLGVEVKDEKISSTSEEQTTELCEKVQQNTNGAAISTDLDKTCEREKSELEHKNIVGADDKNREVETNCEKIGSTSKVQTAELSEKAQPNANSDKMILETYKSRESRSGSKEVGTSCEENGSTLESQTTELPRKTQQNASGVEITEESDKIDEIRKSDDKDLEVGTNDKKNGLTPEDETIELPEKAQQSTSGVKMTKESDKTDESQKSGSKYETIVDVVDKKLEVETTCKKNGLISEVRAPELSEKTQSDPNNVKISLETCKIRGSRKSRSKNEIIADVFDKDGEVETKYEKNVSTLKDQTTEVPETTQQIANSSKIKKKSDEMDESRKSEPTDGISVGVDDKKLEVQTKDEKNGLTLENQTTELLEKMQQNAIDAKISKETINVDECRKSESKVEFIVGDDDKDLEVQTKREKNDLISKVQTAELSEKEHQNANDAAISTESSKTDESQKSRSEDVKASNVDDKNHKIETKLPATSRTNCQNEVATSNANIPAEPAESGLIIEPETAALPDKTQDNAKVESSKTETAVNENLTEKVDVQDKWISVLENDCEVPSIPLTNPEHVNPGSRSFREEKIENIEKFIQDYQEDEDPCTPLILENGEPDYADYQSKFGNTTRSIVDTLSMDIERVPTVEKLVDAIIDNPDKKKIDSTEIAQEILGILSDVEKTEPEKIIVEEVRNPDCPSSKSLEIPDEKKIKLAITQQICEEKSDHEPSQKENIILKQETNAKFPMPFGITDKKMIESAITKEICEVKSSIEIPRVDKVVTKEMKNRPRIPCIPIMSMYSRKRQHIKLTDSVSSKCIVTSESLAKIARMTPESNNNEQNKKNETNEAEKPQTVPKEMRVVLKLVNLKKSPKCEYVLPEFRKYKVVLPDPGADHPKIEVPKKFTETESSTSKNSHVQPIEITNATRESPDPRKTDPSPKTLFADDKIQRTKIVMENAESANQKIVQIPRSKEIENGVMQPELGRESTENSAKNLKKPEKSSAAEKSTGDSEAHSMELRGTRSALKTNVPSPVSNDSGLPIRKRPVLKEKENQSKPIEKQCRIVVVAKRRRPVKLGDCSTAVTLVSSVGPANGDGESTKNNNSMKNASVKSEKTVTTESVTEPAGRGRKRRSNDNK